MCSFLQLWTVRSKNTKHQQQHRLVLYDSVSFPLIEIIRSIILYARKSSWLDYPKIQQNTTNNIQQKTQQMSRHWLRQYTTYDIDAKKPFKPYRMTKNSFKIFALPKPPIWRPRSPIWRFWQYQNFEWIFSHFRKLYHFLAIYFLLVKNLKY